MVCPYCLYDKTEIYNSRATKKLNQVWRRRRCLECHRVFSTSETIELSTILKVIGGKKTTPYQRGTLFASILQACDHRNDRATASFYLLEICEEALLKNATVQTLTTQKLATQVAAILERFDTLAWAKYCGYHSIPFKKSRLTTS